MKIKLYDRNDRYENLVAKVKLVDQNIVLTEDNTLPYLNNIFPDNNRKYIHFESGYSGVYIHESDGLVNVRITYQKETEKGRHHLYCKLNFLNRQKLYFIQRKTFYQKHPIATFTLILALLGTAFGLYKDFFVYESPNDTQDNQHKSQIKIPKKSGDIKQIYLDSLPEKVMVDTMKQKSIDK